jgi:AAA+ ATPase superfamily predicted ATPase
MKFYNREAEITDLDALSELTASRAQMTVITGRRRMGKTMLALHAVATQQYIYFFVSKKAEKLLCDEYVEEIKTKLDVPVHGEFSSFADLFKLLIDLAKNKRFTLIIDEFQEFYHINPAIYSEIQKLWDLQKQSSCHLHLIFIGSVYSLMHKIFEDSKEPLFGRADRIIHLKAFKIITLSHILNDNHIDSIQTLFDYYVFTGGTPKYVDILISNQAVDYDSILNFMLRANSPFLHEGQHVLIQEFGKEYQTYFSILQLMASGKTSRGEIESILQINIGGYLERLLVDYAVIEKYNPIDAEDHSRLQKYRIVDNFLIFWFRFIYKNFSAIENENFDYVRKIIDRDYSVHCGRMLEKFYQELFWGTKKYNKIGSYWEKGNQNEIDLVAVNDFEKKCVIADIKLNENKINLMSLQNKSQKLLKKYDAYEIQWLGLSLQNINAFIKNTI